ncbi:MAG: kinA [Holophagaceae bacterium]|nr:kinA [Holophagaceae bacterium]
MAERFSISIRDRHGFERSVPLPRNVVLGRQNHCDIVLPDSMVSRAHLKVELMDGAWWAEDLNSSHGTFFQDRRITRIKWETDAALRIADGAYTLTLRNEAPFASEVNLQAILQTAHLMSGEIELDDLLEQTLNRLLAISGTDRGFIMLPEGGDLEVKVQHNLGTDMTRNIHLSMSSVRKVFEQGEPIWIHNVASDQELMAQQSVMNLQLKTILCLPLIVQGKCIGVVYLDGQKVITEPVDRATFEAIVSLCAVAIERTRLAEESLHNHVLATVGQVASSIVHDIKNALFVIAGHAQMIGAYYEAGGKAQHHVEEILGAVERLSQLSTDVLDYAKIRDTKLENVEIAPFIRGLVEPLEQRAKDMGIALRAEGPECTGSLDRYRFARVLENLLANALDALTGRADGRVTVRWEDCLGEIRLEVEDNGKGIPKKLQRRIFEPFFTHGKPKGTGLGMATVKKIMEEHKGAIEVRSEEGVGTLVKVTVPKVSTTSPEVSTGGFRTLNSLEKP